MIDNFEEKQLYSHKNMRDVCFYVLEISNNLEKVQMEVLWILKRNCRQLSQDSDTIYVDKNDFHNYYKLTKEQL